MKATASTGMTISLLVVSIACSQPPASVPAPSSQLPATDAQHRGVNTPHGDHSPHHGGMVLMNGDLHYEVVFDRNGEHRIWFSNAVREDLPASVARDVRMQVTRPDAAPESLALAIDDAGESWVAHGKPVSGDNVMVKVSYALQGVPHEVEIPFLIPAQ
jgi:hypothetical protein